MAVSKTYWTRLASLLAAALVAAFFGLNQPSKKPDPTSPDPKQDTQNQPSKQQDKRQSNLPLGSGFDFYVLSLSWSPTWCHDNPDEASSSQCRRSYGLIVHGLWPQNETGYPEDCDSSENDRVPDSLGKSLFDIIPSMGLIGHEWRKHGTCSGLSQADYFKTLRAAWSRISVPDVLSGRNAMTISPSAVEKAFQSANPGLSANAIAVGCSRSALEEIRICLTKDLQFRSCPQVDRSGCRKSSISIPSL